jgi:hypothetical protein
MKRLAILILLLLAGVLWFLWSQRNGSPSEAERNRSFTQDMSGVTLVGHSTRTNREGLSKEERYIIENTCPISPHSQVGGRHSSDHVDGPYDSGGRDVHGPRRPLPRSVCRNVER